MSPRDSKAMKGLIVVLFAAPLVAAHAAALPPPPAEPELAKLYAEARSELDRLSAGSFPRASSSSSWPCAVDERQLRLWAGALGADEMDDKDRRNARLMNLDAGLGAEEGKLTVRDVKVRPLKAQCAEAVLEGVVEYTVDYGAERRFDKFEQRGVLAKHVRVAMTHGVVVPDSPIHVSSLETGRKTTWFDPATQALMKKQRTAEPDQILSASVRLPGEKGLSASITMSRIGSAPPSYSAYMTLATVPGRREERLFLGEELNRVYRYKLGRLHGVQETAPIKVGDKVIMPGTKQCFDDGEEIKVARCDVE